jgi:D-3-phosphoglycerate dehydrogenase
MKVLVVNPKLGIRIKKYLPDDIQIILPEKGEDKELVELVKDVEIILATRLSPEVAEAAANLKLLQKTGAGVDDMPFDSLKDDVWMANTSGSNPFPLAEGAIALMLALAKKIIPRNQKFIHGRTGERGVFLKGKNVGIIGFGSIGKEVAKRLKAFDMNIYAIKRHPDEDLVKELELDFLGVEKDLKFLLNQSDFVIVTIPLTKDTEGMIGEDEIRTMKKTAYIINVARAAIIKEEPLYRALQNREIAGAALDVWWTPHWWDPLWNTEEKGPSKYPFWELPSVICIPHEIGFTDSRSEEGVKIMVNNIFRIKQGKPPINLVDKRLQY